jgi:hypothetical protein
VCGLITPTLSYLTVWHCRRKFVQHWLVRARNVEFCEFPLIYTNFFMQSKLNLYSTLLISPLVYRHTQLEILQLWFLVLRTAWWSEKCDWNKANEAAFNAISILYKLNMRWGIHYKYHSNCNVLNLSTRWKWTVSFMFGHLNPWGKYSWKPSDRVLCGLRSLSRCGGWEKNYNAFAKNSTPTYQSAAQHFTNWASTFSLKYKCTLQQVRVQHIFIIGI